jgi:hypothetical protein
MINGGAKFGKTITERKESQLINSLNGKEGFQMVFWSYK